MPEMVDVGSAVLQRRVAVANHNTKGADDPAAERLLPRPERESAGDD